MLWPLVIHLREHIRYTFAIKLDSTNICRTLTSPTPKKENCCRSGTSATLRSWPSEILFSSLPATSEDVYSALSRSTFAFPLIAPQGSSESVVWRPSSSVSDVHRTFLVKNPTNAKSWPQHFMVFLIPSFVSPSPRSQPPELEVQESCAGYHLRCLAYLKTK